MINYLSRQKLRNADEIPVFVGQYFFYQVGQTLASLALQESKNTNFEENSREDYDNVMNIFGTISNGKILNTDIGKFYRLGKKGERDRPLLVRFVSKSVKNINMDNLKNCVNLEERF